MFQILKYFKPPYEVVGTFVLPFAFFAVLFFWPVLDRNPQRDPRKRPIAIALLALGSVALVGLTVFAVANDVRMRDPGSAAATEPALESAAPMQKLDVADVYMTNCAACHGIDGKGQQLRVAMPTLPDFTNLVWQRRQSDEQIIQQIQNGKLPLMPAFKAKLTGEEARWLAIYVRAFAIRPDTSSLEPATAPATNQ
jgi:mono/diheme cytochrome c family protein